MIVHYQSETATVCVCQTKLSVKSVNKVILVRMSVTLWGFHGQCCTSFIRLNVHRLHLQPTSQRYITPGYRWTEKHERLDTSNSHTEQPESAAFRRQLCLSSCTTQSQKLDCDVSTSSSTPPTVNTNKTSPKQQNLKIQKMWSCDLRPITFYNWQTGEGSGQSWTWWHHMWSIKRRKGVTEAWMRSECRMNLFLGGGGGG